MDLALNNLKSVICHKTQTNKQIYDYVPQPTGRTENFIFRFSARLK